MAVQAQYPSNILLLKRNGQEGHDYSSQQPQLGGFLDQSSHMLFNNGGTNNSNPRKRGREFGATSVAAAATSGGITAQTIHQLSVQSHHRHHHHHHQSSQLIDLPQLHNQAVQTNAVSTGLGLSFGDQQQQQLQQQNPHYHNQQQQQRQQQGSFLCQSSAPLSLLSEDFATQFKRQRDELDQFLQAQGEQLRHTLAEKRQRHYRALVGVAEESIARRLREKEAEVEKATRRNGELEARAAQLNVEAQVWQAKARAQEATAASLQAQLQQAIMSGGGLAQDSTRRDDGLVGLEGQAEDAESAYVDPDRVTALSGGPSCKSCRKRVASVVLLPCRHLCVCTECDQVVQACPVCLQARNSSVEVFLY